MEGWEMDELFKEHKKKSEAFRSMITFKNYLEMFEAKNHLNIIKKQEEKRSFSSWLSQTLNLDPHMEGGMDGTSSQDNITYRRNHEGHFNHGIYPQLIAHGTPRSLTTVWSIFHS